MTELSTNSSLNVCQFWTNIPPSLWYKQKSSEHEVQLSHQFGGMGFLDHTFYVFVDEVVMKILVYLLIMNPSLYENIVNIS